MWRSSASRSGRDDRHEVVPRGAEAAVTSTCWSRRWNADYDDPDDFTFSLFHSGAGHFQAWFSSRRGRPARRRRRVSRAAPPSAKALYRRFEQLLLESAVFIPLFHEVDYRIAGPDVRGVALRSTPPFVNYAEVGKAEAPAAPGRARMGRGHPSTCRSAASCTSFDPASHGDHRAGRDRPERLRDADARRRGRARRAVARLGVRCPRRAARASASACGGVCASTTAARFHARDVRYSFERLLQIATSAAGSCSRRSAERQASSMARPRTSRASTSSRPRSS